MKPIPQRRRQYGIFIKVSFSENSKPLTLEKIDLPAPASAELLRSRLALGIRRGNHLSTDLHEQTSRNLIIFPAEVHGTLIGTDDQFGYGCLQAQRMSGELIRSAARLLCNF
jgi:hypothetical protein